MWAALKVALCYNYHWYAYTQMCRLVSRQTFSFLLRQKIRVRFFSFLIDVRVLLIDIMPAFPKLWKMQYSLKAQ